MIKEALGSSPSDSELLARFEKGDLSAFSDLYERYSAPIFRFALHRVTDPEVALDVVQDVFLKILVGKFDLREEPHLKIGHLLRREILLLIPIANIPENQDWLCTKQI